MSATRTKGACNQTIDETSGDLLVAVVIDRLKRFQYGNNGVNASGENVIAIEHLEAANVHLKHLTRERMEREI